MSRTSNPLVLRYRGNCSLPIGGLSVSCHGRLSHRRQSSANRRPDRLYVSTEIAVIAHFSYSTVTYT
jgi:hypothetical protein